MADEQASRIIERYNDFARKVEDLKLQKVAEMRYILDVSGVFEPDMPSLSICSRDMKLWPLLTQKHPVHG